MSGLIGDIAATAQALAGTSPVTLGPFVFQDTEVPEQIPYGGAQRLAVQKLIGGQRQIQALGTDPRDIIWHGIIRTANRAQRAAELQQMMASGQQFALTWGGEYLQVVIRSFEPVAMPFWTAYTLRCVVLADLSTPSATQKPDLLSQTTQDALSAVGLTPADLSSASAAVGQLSSAVSAVSAIAPGSSAFSTILGATGVAQSALTGAVSAADGNLSGVISAASVGVGILGASDTQDGINKLGSAVTAAGDVGGALQALGYVNRIGQNLAAQL